MALSRKREKELKRLRDAASDLWDDQKDVLEHASRVVREASRQAAQVGREEVAPRVKDAIDHSVKPVLASGVAAGRSVADTAKDKFARDVLPSVSSALASAIAVLEVAKDPRVREALSRAGKVGTQFTSKTVVAPARHTGPGRYILIGVGLVALAGVAYAAWQTLRADDELWVTDDTDEPLPTPPTPATT
ncbi:hypothetical protein [Lacisediminihabitans profunda]|uniref:DNA helicase n=1 Tax=Lacisediminihabitans profunda TaxID=2594790 RepID=A0A5C8ULM6_9MICO|nr:hypothetical protein [Lacisediminihabitans profunda]TXN29289.1 hypothetical protein FVP33_14005 [Lacisediminihabitans profunda]